jgi:predicted extracellular nuclease
MKTWTTVFLVLFLAVHEAYCQQTSSAGKPLLQVMFWNTENLFDTFNDSTVNDEEFLPGALRAWNFKKYETKRNHIYQVITAIGGWDPPDVIGLAEVENRFVLNDLVTNTPLAKYNYRIVHKNSPDPRGIDVALLCREDRFRVIDKRYFPVYNAGGKIERTREILYVAGITGHDTLHIFVNHWPSRAGRKNDSELKRCRVALTLKSKTDSLLRRNPKAFILITGDFNDEPTDESLIRCLGAKTDTAGAQSNGLYNLSALLSLNGKIRGTHKYEGKWAILDQVIVSGSLLQKGKHICTDASKLSVFTPDFLLEKDDRWMGYKPFRTYNGMQYQGGYSDHLPVIIKLVRK